MLWTLIAWLEKLYENANGIILFYAYYISWKLLINIILV